MKARSNYRTAGKFRGSCNYNFAGINSTFHVPSTCINFVWWATHEKTRNFFTPRNFLPVRYPNDCKLSMTSYCQTLFSRVMFSHSSILHTVQWWLMMWPKPTYTEAIKTTVRLAMIPGTAVSIIPQRSPLFFRRYWGSTIIIPCERAHVHSSGQSDFLK